LFKEIQKTPTSAAASANGEPTMGLDDALLSLVDDEIAKFDATKITDLTSKLDPSIIDFKPVLEDLQEFIDSFAIAPAGFTAIELAKRFGNINEQIEVLDGNTEDVKAAVNRAIGDINTFKNSDISIDIDPPGVNTNSVPSVVKNIVNGLCSGGCGWNGKVSVNIGRFTETVPSPFGFLPDIPPIE